MFGLNNGIIRLPCGIAMLINNDTGWSSPIQSLVEDYLDWMLAQKQNYVEWMLLADRRRSSQVDRHVAPHAPGASLTPHLSTRKQ